MVIKRRYKPDLTDSKILKPDNILSWHTKTTEYLEINELGWGFIWCLVKRKLKTKIYMMVCTISDGYSIEFFSKKKE